jgi:hypothetical protein
MVGKYHAFYSIGLGAMFPAFIHHMKTWGCIPNIDNVVTYQGYHINHHLSVSHTHVCGLKRTSSCATSTCITIILRQNSLSNAIKLKYSFFNLQT